MGIVWDVNNFLQIKLVVSGKWEVVGKFSLEILLSITNSGSFINH